MTRTIIVGDIHGCIEEFEELLKTLSYTGEDRLVLAGDLVDRGPDSVGVVRKAQELGCEVVMGNHDLKHVRWSKWEAKVASGEAQKNPMKFGADKIEIFNGFSEKDLAWLKKLPSIIRLNEHCVVVHGGLAPKRSVEKQNAKQVTMIRFVDKDKGNFVGIRSIGAQPENTDYWSEVWTGPETVFYGHAVHSLEAPRRDQHEGYSCWGLDTGCVFGGRLSAAVLTDDGPDPEVEIVQVKAKKAYSERYPAGYKFE